MAHTCHTHGSHMAHTHMSHTCHMLGIEFHSHYFIQERFNDVKEATKVKGKDDAPPRLDPDLQRWCMLHYHHHHYHCHNHHHHHHQHRHHSFDEHAGCWARLTGLCKKCARTRTSSVPPCRQSSARRSSRHTLHGIGFDDTIAMIKHMWLHKERSNACMKATEELPVQHPS